MRTSLRPCAIAPGGAKGTCARLPSPRGTPLKLRAGNCSLCDGTIRDNRTEPPPGSRRSGSGVAYPLKYLSSVALISHRPSSRATSPSRRTWRSWAGIGTLFRRLRAARCLSEQAEVCRPLSPTPQMGQILGVVSPGGLPGLGSPVMVPGKPTTAGPTAARSVSGWGSGISIWVSASTSVLLTIRLVSVFRTKGNSLEANPASFESSAQGNCRLPLHFPARRGPLPCSILLCVHPP